MKDRSSTTPIKKIENMILTLRGQKVILDRDHASLYGVSTKAFNQAVKRNPKRFPSHFVFQLTSDEKKQLVTNCDRFNSLKHSSTAPRAFTEHGALMSANVLNSENAIQVSVLVVEAFIRLRKTVMEVKELAEKVNALEAKYDSQFKIVFDAVKKLISSPTNPKKKIGFHGNKKSPPLH